MAMNVEAEIRDLKRRVSEIEGSFGVGTFGFLTHQISDFHKDLLAFQEKTEQRFDKLDGRLDKVDGRLDRLESKIDSVDRKIDTKIGGLAKSLPGIISNTMREVLRERPPKKP
jgi:tetrahydromethanopterin S-methyltransferase subunit G